MSETNNQTTNGIGGKKSSRIEYIDAMRGFTMLLVVITHVSIFGLGIENTDRYSQILGEFRMPLFFFVSGFVLFKAGFNWNIANTLNFLSKKIPVQLISPFLFLLACVLIYDKSLVETLFSFRKGGYWFTFTLFEYFLMYIVLQWIVKLVRLKSIAEDVLLLGAGAAVYMATIYSLIVKYGMEEGYMGLWGVPNLHYFIFFIIGNRVRKYFAQFEKLLDTRYFTLICVAIFFIFNIVPETKLLSSTGWNFLTSLSGILIVFALFRQKSEVFSHETRVGRIAQYVGRRTLDIYLLHFFFVYSNMQAVLPDFSEVNSPFLQFSTSLGVAVWVICACLVLSQVLRLNPILAHYLFGQKLEK